VPWCELSFVPVTSRLIGFQAVFSYPDRFSGRLAINPTDKSRLAGFEGVSSAVTAQDWGSDGSRLMRRTEAMETGLGEHHCWICEAGDQGKVQRVARALDAQRQALSFILRAAGSCGR
jgi:hypothetical protein